MNSRGTPGEDAAAKFLTAHGYTIAVRNYFSRYGEIDIVAVLGDTLAFIEVKARAENAFYTGAEAVTGTKQQKLIKTAYMFMDDEKYAEFAVLQPRFDVVDICMLNPHKYRVRHIKGAFDTSCMPKNFIF